MKKLIKKVSTASGINSVEIKQSGSIFSITIKPGCLILNNQRNHSTTHTASNQQEANYYFEKFLTEARRREI